MQSFENKLKSLNMKIFTYSTVVALVAITSLSSCTKKTGPLPVPPQLANVFTIQASSIQTNLAVSGGNVTSDNGFAVTSRGVVEYIYCSNYIFNHKDFRWQRFRFFFQQPN